MALLEGLAAAVASKLATRVIEVAEQFIDDETARQRRMRETQVETQTRHAQEDREWFDKLCLKAAIVHVKHASPSTDDLLEHIKTRTGG